MEAFFGAKEKWLSQGCAVTIQLKRKKGKEMGNNDKTPNDISQL